MAKSSSLSTARSGGIPALRYDTTAAVAANRRLVRAATEAQAHALERTIRIGVEMLDFVRDRLACDRKVLNEFVALKDPRDSAALWTTFFETAMREYCEGIQRLIGVCADQVREVTAEAQHQLQNTIAAATCLEADRLETRKDAA